MTTAEGPADEAMLYGPDARALAALVVLFALTRGLAVLLGIGADPDVVVHHWQNLPLRALADDLVGALAGLRSQPPLWNGLMGLAAGACDAEAACTAAALVGLNRVLTLACVLLLYGALRRLHLSVRLSFAAGALALLSPSVVFYEAYAFYPQVTAFLAVVSLAGLAGMARRPSPGAMALVLAGIAGLSLTVTVWHPLAVAGLGAALVHALPARAVRTGILVAVVAVLVAAAPAVKNLAAFGQFAGGSWGGLNLAQVAPGLTDAERWQCSFGRLLAEGGLGTGPLEGEILNRAETAEASKACVPVALRAIAARPLEWMADVAHRTAASHLKAPYHYFFAPPGFARWPHVAAPESLADPGGPSSATVLLLALGFLYYPAVAVAALSVAVRHRGRGPGLFAAIGLAMVVWQTVVSHAANGGEQQRMRYTLEPVYLALAAVALADGRGRRRQP